MEIVFKKQPGFKLSEKTRRNIVELIISLFILLFMYTAAAKLMDLKSFASTLAKSPLIGKLNWVVAWSIPGLEMIITVFLILPGTKRTGLYASLLLMTVFTLYLSYMVLSGSKLPCHCGGVISTMSWQQHIWFNLGFIGLAIAALTANQK